MRTATVRAPLSPGFQSVADQPPRAATVLAIAAAAALIAAPTLVALTHGWDYRLAVLSGAWIAAGALVVGRGAVRADDVNNRLELEFATAFVVTLLCAYAADWLDWRPFGTDDALAGLAVGLALVVASPVRRALRLVAQAPAQANFALQVLVVAPAVAPLLAALHGESGALDARHVVARLAGYGIPVVLAVTGMAFASRRGLHEAVFPLSLLSGFALFALLAASGAPPICAGLAGVLAGVSLALFGLRAWWRVAGTRHGWQPGGLFAWLAIAGAATVHIHPGLLGSLVAALVGAWWWLEAPRTQPAPAPAKARPTPGAFVLSGTFAVSIAALYFALGALLPAAVSNATGPMVLAMIGAMTPYKVSDLKFSQLLIADQYLWRDAPAPSRFVAAASPERLVEMLRTDRDRWSGVELVAATRARMARRVRGTGLGYGPETDDGILVAYVYPGSPAARAGVRRGEVLRAVNGVRLDGLGTAASVSPPAPGSARLELGYPGQPSRTVTIELAEYSRAAVSAERVLHVEGRRVGYLVLHGFSPSASAEFLEAAERLRASGIEELVLDLRTNPGGLVDSARDIASAIGGGRLDGEVFQRLVHNERYRDRDKDIAFHAPARGALSLPRLFVITSEDTCSASEAVINGLAPFMTVVTVGTTTCGKPVGMTAVEYGDHAYWVITFRVLNARGEGDYFDGLRPTCPAEDDFGHELGDPDEASLRTALHFIREGRCPDRGRGAASAVLAGNAS